jgi:L-idonate 5-dehydrogenase
MKAVAIFAKQDLRLVERESLAPGPGQVRIAVEWAGICGSDISYFLHGRSGTVEIKQPLIVGHEFSGTVLEIGPSEIGSSENKTLKIGDKITVFPAKPIPGIELPDRLAGRDNLLAKVEYYGSAALPTDGGFVQEKIVDLNQAKKLPDGVSLKIAALAEPLSVAAHAVSRAGEIDYSKDILINGAGPIGLLILAWLKFKGAGSAQNIIVADLSDKALNIAKNLGANKIINISQEPLPNDIEIVFEASGVMSALENILQNAARGGTIVQVGNLPIIPQEAVLGQLVTREINWKGSFRFTEKEFSDVVNSLDKIQGLDKIISHSFSLSQYEKAFETAVDKTQGSSKVLVNISENLVENLNE